MGTVAAIKRGCDAVTLSIYAKKILEDMKIGDSIAVNGVCLTVVSFDAKGFQANVMHETIRRSTLENLVCGSMVNLERAMAADGRFGGHLVAGHVDGVGKITRIHRDGIAMWYTIQAPKQIMRYIVEKGSITIDGISLTVASVEREKFSVSTIPHTMQVTTLKERKTGDMVNLENDIIGKYVERLFGKENVEKRELREGDSEKNVGEEKNKKQGITEEFLLKCGY